MSLSCVSKQHMFVYFNKLSSVRWRWVNKIVIPGSRAYEQPRLTAPHEVDPRPDEMDGSAWIDGLSLKRAR